MILKFLLTISTLTSLTASYSLSESKLEELTATIAANSFQYFLNNEAFSSPIEDMVKVYCHQNGKFVEVSSKNITLTVTDPSKPYVIIIHGWTDTYRIYYVNGLADGKSFLSSHSFRNL